jgi:peptidoglycan/LPS O-acetylase OafA/YrhL
MNEQFKLPRADELDGLRGMLAIWVAVSHILCWSGFATITLPRPLGNFWPDFIFAQPAVETFIILSGFAISFLLHAKKQSYMDFMRGRFYRIYPTYLVCLILGMATIYITPTIIQEASWRNTIYFEWIGANSQSERLHPFLHTFLHLTLLNGLIPHRILPNTTGTLLPPAWSISLEWQYYIVAPFIAFFVRSGVGLLILGMVAYIGLQLGSHWSNPHLAFLPAQLPLFMVGIGSYHFYAHFARPPGPRSARFAAPISALFAAAILLSSHSVALAIWALAFGCIFVAGDDLFARALGLVRGFLLHPLLQRLGRISYPLYLVHWPVIIICMAVLLRWKSDIGSMGAGILMLLIATPLILLVSGLLHHFIEKPLMKLGKQPAQSDNALQRAKAGGAAPSLPDA